MSSIFYLFIYLFYFILRDGVILSAVFNSPFSFVLCGHPRSMPVVESICLDTPLREHAARTLGMALADNRTLKHLSLPRLDSNFAHHLLDAISCHPELQTIKVDATVRAFCV
jgi:hypothetical protein